MNTSLVSGVKPETTSNIFPFLLVLACAIMEPMLINNLMSRLNFENTPMFIWLSHIIIGLWIIVIWVLLAIIPHLFSLLYDAEGKFKLFLFNVGYGFIPMIIGIGISYYIMNHHPLPNTTDLVQLKKDPTIKLISMVNMISMTLTIPWVIYTIYLFKRLTFVQSLVCVLLPFSILYLLSNLIASLLS
ncbi:hypothetical protein IM793_06085 [Pedobacter sp. MR2016-19]|uniref:hypothetical protein n=1 Tax=Pedobacter sp. MR2016-19 TaxID=2780089 RepID=UPI0018740C74|nr:hypothetical protein [Pedobacter sp. MR2016-19]MBE5318715.1 hypothetical protein [Pedobacter sp. MR2016-19]